MVQAANPLYALTTVTAVANLVISLDANLKMLSSANAYNKADNNTPSTSAAKSKEEYYCSIHLQNRTHNTADCHVRNRQLQANRSLPTPSQHKPTQFTSPSTTVMTRSSTSTATPHGNLTCNLCGKAGHWAKNCYKNTSNSSNGKSKVSVRQVMVQEESLSDDNEDNNDDNEDEPDVIDYQEINDNVINIRRVHVPTMQNGSTSKANDSALSLSQAQQPAIPVPLTLNDCPYLGVLDCGASNTIISSTILKDIQVSIIPQDGIIVSYQGKQERRIGITSPLTLRCGDKTIQQSFEIANLPEDTLILIGYDLFSILGFSIMGIPNNFPDTQPQPALIAVDEPDPIISSDPTKDEQTEEFKYQQTIFLQQIQSILIAHEQSLLTQPGTFCTIPESMVELPIPKDKQIYVRQYPIPHTLIPIMDECVEKWKKDGVVTPAPINCRFNNPLTMAPKKDSFGNMTLKRPCLDPRHINKLLPEDR